MALVNVSVSSTGVITVDATALKQKCASKCKGKIDACTQGFMDMLDPIKSGVKQAGEAKAEIEGIIASME